MAYEGTSIKNVFSVSNYRYYFTAQTFSLIGTWMYSTAMSWLVWRITGSATIVGSVGFIGRIPALVFSYPAGVVADRVDIKKALYITQSFTMILAFIIAVLTLSGSVKIWHVISVSFMLGVLGSFDMPFRQSFIMQIVPRKLLHSAIALNSVMFNVSRIIGSTIAGFVVKYAGEGWCFLINALSYFAILFALAKIKTLEKVREKEKDFLKSFIDGISYIKNTPYIKYPILHMFLLSFVIMPVITMMPVYVKKMNGDARTLGFFMSCIGIGAILGGLSLASKSKANKYTKMVNLFSTLYGVSLFLLSVSRNIYFSCFFLLLTGISSSRQVVGINTIIQSLVSEDMRGRVVSIYSLSFIGLGPFGNLIWGYISAKYTIDTTLLLSSLWVISSNLIFYINMLNVKKRLFISEEKKPEYDIL
ncbi:MAG: MFS transporter [Elusimicrobiales bacterium]